MLIYFLASGAADEFLALNKFEKRESSVASAAGVGTARRRREHVVFKNLPAQAWNRTGTSIFSSAGTHPLSIEVAKFPVYERKFICAAPL
jgi:hypothetical protein